MGEKILTMFQKFVHFMADERGAVSSTALLPLAAGAGLACLAAHSLAHHHLAHGLGITPDGLGGGLDPGAARVGVAVPVVAGAGTIKKKGWEWDCGGKMLLMNRDLARDRLLFSPPRDDNDNQITLGKLEAPIDLHTGEKLEQRGLYWKWPGDGRVFLIPLDLAERAGLLGLARDVVAYLTRCYVLEQRGTGDKEIEFYIHELADALGLAWRGRDTVEALSRALDLGRALTVRNMPVRVKTKVPANKNRTKFKEVVEVKQITFGFLDGWGRTVMRDGRPIPKNKQPCSAFLSRWYQHMLDKFPVAPVPAAAIEAANNAPARIRGAVKNLAYHLAARVPAPEGKVRLLLTTLQEICHTNGYRWPSEIRKSLENIMKILHPTLIRDFSYKKNGYNIILAGTIRSDKKPTGND